MATTPPATDHAARTSTSPARSRPQGAGTSASEAQPTIELANVTPDSLCVTSGKLAVTRVAVPTFRAVATANAGDAAALAVTVRGQTAKLRALDSGEQRRQLGLKLRAEDGCNLVYVMWRLDPKPKIDVSVKRNAGMHTSKECGANGYTKVKPVRGTHYAALPTLDDGTTHELRAEINGDSLTAWVDGHVAWEGVLPEDARYLVGPAGVRSDDLDFDVTGFAADARPGVNVKAKCVSEEPEEGRLEKAATEK